MNSLVIHGRTAGAYAAAVTLGLATLAGCSSVDDAKPETKTFSFDDQSLAIDFDEGDIQVKAADIDDVEVTRRFTGDSDDATWALGDATLTLATHCGWLSSCEVSYQVTVPADVAVALGGTSGDVQIDDFAAPVSIRTENGSQKAKNLSSPDVKAQADNGRIDLSFAEAPEKLDVSTDNGAVHIGLPDDDYDFDIDTDNGKVNNDFDNDDEASSSIRIRTDNGEVSVARND